MTVTDGTLEPTLDADDEPTWAQAMGSDEREYWIAGGRDELKSLEDLKVFVLVPRSEVPTGQRPLKGKLVCKRKCDESGNIVHYKVRYVAKGFAQRYCHNHPRLRYGRHFSLFPFLPSPTPPSSPTYVPDPIQTGSLYGVVRYIIMLCEPLVLKAVVDDASRC